jgi:ferredoxin-NADP reductase
VKLTLKSKKHEVGDIWSFVFESSGSIAWEAGQYLNLTLPGLPPVNSDRIFTISSAPHEKYIMITTFLQDAPYKNRLQDLKIGEKVEADQVGGDFTFMSVIPVLNQVQHKASAGIQTKQLFLAGGLGITPFRSMIVDSFLKKQQLDAILMWAGKDPQCPFEEELTKLANRSKDVSIKRYANKRIDVDEIYSETPDVEERIIYVAGSQKFVEGLGEALMEKGIPRTQIKYDWFDGYFDGVLV